MQISKQTKHMGVLVVRPIGKDAARRLILGVAAFGWMIEPNRMWIDDCPSKNAETILIGASLRMLRKLDPTIEAVQSFADGRIGCGTIYKAANFDYYGYHWTTFLHNSRSGEINHGQNLSNSTCASSFLRTNAELLAGDMIPFLVKPHRYIYPLPPQLSLHWRGQETIISALRQGNRAG